MPWFTSGGLGLEFGLAYITREMLTLETDCWQLT